jgi:hypothetical protein
VDKGGDVFGPITALLGLFFLMLQDRKSVIYSPKQARKVIKLATKEKIGFIICPSYTRKFKLNKKL